MYENIKFFINEKEKDLQSLFITNKAYDQIGFEHKPYDFDSLFDAWNDSVVDNVLDHLNKCTFVKGKNWQYQGNIFEGNYKKYIYTNDINLRHFRLEIFYKK